MCVRHKKHYIDLMIAVLLSAVLVITSNPPTWESFLNTVADQLQNDGLKSLHFVLSLAAWCLGLAIIAVFIYLTKPKLLEVLWLFVGMTAAVSAELIILMPWSLQLIVLTIFMFLSIRQLRHMRSESKTSTSTNKKESILCSR